MVGVHKQVDELGHGPLASAIHGTETTETTETEPVVAGNGNGQVDVGQIDEDTATFRLQEDAPPCHECGAIMVRGGSCYKCLNCGATSGCS